MFYILTGVIFGLLATAIQSKVGAKMFSGLWWAIGIVMWFSVGLFSFALSQLID